MNASEAKGVAAVDWCHTRIWHAIARVAPSRPPWLSGLVLGALLLPATLYAVVAWQDRLAVLQQAEQNAQETALILAEHADNVFETHRLIAKLANERIRGMSWSEIATSPGVHEFLADIIRDQPRIRSLWLIDPSGRVRNSSVAFPVPEVSVSDRDYFVGLREGDTGTFIGQVVHGRVIVEDIFNVAQRRQSDSKTFDGVVVVSALPSYLTEFWSSVTHDTGSAILVRRDGTVLARLPSIDPVQSSLPADDFLMQAIGEGKDAGFYRAASPADAVERLFAYQKLDNLPIYVGRAIDVSAALLAWHQHLELYGAFFAIGAVGMVSLALVASYRLERWRRSTLELRDEMEHRAKVELQLRQAQKMEALGQLTGETAHDFGNILHVIGISLEMLEHRPGDMKSLALARQATDRGVKATQAMLAFARRQSLRPAVVDVNDVLRGMDSLLRQAIGSQNKLNIDLAAAPCWISADRNQMELAILNIAINARDAMPRGGVLTVTTRIERLTGDPDGLEGDYAVIAMVDTGIGMPPDVREHALEPFFTTKGPARGTGLGLSMVYGFSKQSGGALAIESEVGQGTRVMIYLPIIQPDRDRGHMSSLETS